jgi:hypothetical protein
MASSIRAVKVRRVFCAHSAIHAICYPPFWITLTVLLLELKNILNEAVRAVCGYAAVLERLHTHQLGVEQRVPRSRGARKVW